MKSIQITEYMRTQAREWADIETRGFTVGGNYTKLEEPGAFYHGLLGELCVFEYLKTAGRQCDYFVELRAKAGRHDFLFHFPIGARTIDVKTASQPHYQRMMFPQAQPYSYDYYIGVRLNQPTAELWGYCRMADFSGPDLFGTKKVPTMWRFLEHLRPIEELIGKMNPGPATLYVTK